MKENDPEKAKIWQRYEARTLKRAAAEGPEAKARAEESLSFFRNLGHSGKPVEHDVRELARAVLDGGREAAAKLKSIWDDKDRARVENAERVLAKHARKKSDFDRDR